MGQGRKPRPYGALGKWVGAVPPPSWQFYLWKDLSFPTLPPWLAQVVAQHVLMSWPLDFVRKMWMCCKVGGLRQERMRLIIP